jgi:DnaJ family protein C protein 17
MQTFLSGSLDTTVRLKYTLTAHPSLRDATSISGFLSPFGSTDLDTIRISLKPPKKAPEKPPKFATVLAEFKQIGGAFAAVCASGRADRGLSGIQIDWVEGKEPEIIGWLKKRGALGGGTDRSHVHENPSGETGRKRPEEKPQTQKVDSSAAFSSFPEALVRRFYFLLLSFPDRYS